jgi:hypothetical protein
LAFHGWRKIDVTLERLKMKKIPKQAYTAEFKELAVKRVNDGVVSTAIRCRSAEAGERDHKKKRRRTSRGMFSEVRLDWRTYQGVCAD